MPPPTKCLSLPFFQFLPLALILQASHLSWQAANSPNGLPVRGTHVIWTDQQAGVKLCIHVASGTLCILLGSLQ